MLECSGREEDLGGAFPLTSLSVVSFLPEIQNAQTRLLDENKVLSLTCIAGLIVNVQNMHNDIDKANEPICKDLKRRYIPWRLKRGSS